MRMSSRIDAVAQRVQTAVTMKQLTGSMAGVVKSMDAALKQMNLEKVGTCPNQPIVIMIVKSLT